MKKKIGLALAGLTVTKEALAMAVASVAVVAVAPTLGFDPWTWVLGAAGGMLAQAFLPADKAKPEPTNRLTSFLSWIHGRKMHFLVVFASVILAGVGSEYVVRVFSDQQWTVPNIYIVAFVLSSTWPFAVHLTWKKAVKWSES